MNAVVIRINILKNDEKLSSERNELFFTVENAEVGLPNCATTKIKVIAKPKMEIYGSTFLSLLKIKSKTTIATSVSDNAISGKIASRLFDKFGKINVITYKKLK